MPEFAHSALRVSDLERSLAFYRLLGFAERRRFEARDPAFMRALNLSAPTVGAFIGLDADIDRLELLQTPGSPVITGNGFHHTGIRVENLDGLLERLAEAG